MRALGWLLLAALGGVAQLLLTRAGHGVNYQHFEPLNAATPVAMAAAALLLLQLVLVSVALVRQRAAVRATLAALVPGWRLLALVALVYTTSAALSADPRTFALEIVLLGTAQVLQLATVGLGIAAMPADTGATWRARIDRILGTGDGATDGVPLGRLALIAAAWTVLVSWLLAAIAYQRIPHIPDEVVYLLHAKYFAQGMLTMPAPPDAEGFSLDLMTLKDGRWFSPVPPGWPAVLALGLRLGMPWLVNPLIAGVNVLLAAALLKEIYPPRTVRLTLLLLATSPWALFMAMNLTTHTVSLAFALGAALAVARLRRGDGILWGVLGGVLIGAVSLVRPLEGIAVALLLGLWSLGARWRGLPLVPAAILTLSTVAAGAVNLPYNRALTGNPRVFPIMDYTDRVYGPGTNSLGFGPEKGLGWSGLDPFPGHGARDVVVNTAINTFQVNVETLGWSCGALVAVWALVLAGRRRKGDLLMAAVIAMIVGLHALYWFSGGPDFGARYWYLILVPVLALAARGIEEADDRLRARAGPGPSAPGIAGVFALLAILAFVPWRAADKYYHYRGMRPDVRAYAEEPTFQQTLVLVMGPRHPDYHGAAIFNPVDLRSDAPVFAWAATPRATSRILAAYPDRRVWVVKGPSLTPDHRYQLFAGPLRPNEVMSRLMQR